MPELRRRYSAHLLYHRFRAPAQHSHTSWRADSTDATLASPRASTDSGELAEAHDDGDIFQASPDELPAIDIHSL